MAIETLCPGCGRKLQVADEHAGKSARCPMCNEIYTVPGRPDPAARESQWHVRTPEGQTYGPVARSELDAWVAQGRVSADCLLSSDERPQWVRADAVYGVLAAPAVAPQAARPISSRLVAPHRGVLILVLGVMSWAVGCPIFGACAWAMGSTDLREMQLGRMDTSGQGLTQAGQIIGMIHVLLVVLLMIGMLFVVLLGVAWQ